MFRLLGYYALKTICNIVGGNSGNRSLRRPWDVIKDYKWKTVPDINSTYEVSQRGESYPCEWYGCFDITAERDEYNSFDGSCSGGVYQTVTYDKFIVYVEKSSSIHVRVTALFNFTCDFSYFLYQRIFRTDNTVISSECSALSSISSISSNISSGNGYAGYGGTVTTSVDCSDVTTWVTGTSYAISELAKNGGGVCYICKLAHTSAAWNEPGIGASWATYWTAW